jgi:D-proline reductase (dithiol) PrdB
MQPPPTQYIAQTTHTYVKLGFKPYQWFAASSEPAFAPLTKPLSESKLTMISTAGTYVQGQVAYHYKDDTSVRVIPNNTPTDKIRFSHIMENYLIEARQDPLTVFPLNALQTLKDEGVVGALTDNYLSCMGGIYSKNRVLAELIPNIEAALEREQPDVLLLVPL